jgi:excinuclease ABC subunit C
MKNDALKLQVKTLPNEPGVYQYYNDEGSIIYVGKAKNLRKRVASYFQKNIPSKKTRNLVNNIHTIKHVVVATESDALLLENTLIKEHQPKYNILLRDDKTYPWICIKKERFPRVFVTRKLIKDGSEYFGPFTNFKTVRVLMDLISELYPLRTCHYDLSQDKIENNKYKVCLEFHIGNCLGGCVGNQSADDYQKQIIHIRELLRGNFKSAKQDFKQKMMSFSEGLDFENAQKIKEKLTLLDQYQHKSTVVNATITNVDVFSIVSDQTSAYVNFLQVAFGSIVRFHTLEIRKKMDESDEAILGLAAVELRQRFSSDSKEVLAPFNIDLGSSVKVIIPKIGDKKHLLDLSIRNAKMARLEQLKQMKITDPNRHAERIMAQMQKDLRLSEPPHHIECFDNSNIQGTHPAAACVVFKDGKPEKKSYRHYHIKTVEGPDDFASMEEVVFRRYKRLLNEDASLPQLIVVDGGKGQLSSALKSLEVLGLRGKIAIIGIAKRLEELYYPDDPIPLYLDKKSETLKIIQQLRNEAHRFGIALHRKKRSNTALNSSLEKIEGIGEKTIISLLKSFKSVKRIQAAPFDELEKHIGSHKAQLLIRHFKSNSE